MNVHSNVTEKYLINLGKLAEQQKNQRTFKIKNRLFKQTHDIKLAESLSPITKNLDVIIESAKQLSEMVKKSDLVDGNIQTGYRRKFNRYSINTCYFNSYGEK